MTIHYYTFSQQLKGSHTSRALLRLSDTNYTHTLGSRVAVKIHKIASRRHILAHKRAIKIFLLGVWICVFLTIYKK